MADASFPIARRVAAAKALFSVGHKKLMRERARPSSAPFLAVQTPKPQAKTAPRVAELAAAAC